MVDWPLTVLPNTLLVEGTVEQMQDQRVRFQPDAGAAIITSIFTKPVKTMQAQLGPLRDYQKDFLDNWIEVTLVGGVTPFNWQSAAWDGAAGDTYTFRFVTLPSYSLLLPRKIFSGVPATEGPAGPGYVTWTPTQRTWIASFTLERLPWFP